MNSARPADLRARARAEYLAYLGSHGLQPHRVPENAAELRRATFERMYHAALGIGDTEYAQVLESRYRAGEIDLRHPSEIAIERMAARVEAMIRADREFAAADLSLVHVGEFPTGSFNAEATTTSGGVVLVLLNTGTLVMTQAIWSTLATIANSQSAARDPTVVQTVASIVLHYLRADDPMYGPLPLAPGHHALLANALGEACNLFIVAHEFAHVLLGHLDTHARPLRMLNTSSGELAVIEKNWQMELDADRLAHRLLLGVDDPAKLDGTLLNRKFAGEGEDKDLGAIFAAVRLKCLLMAPLLFFSIDRLIQDVYAASLGREAGMVHSETHPPTDQRIRQLGDRIFGRVPDSWLNYILFPAAVGELANEIARRIRAGEDFGC